MNLDKLIKSGTSLQEPPNPEDRELPTDLIFLSLRTALHSFFELSQAYSHPDDTLINVPSGKQKVNTQYLESYYRSIIHFQHFFELAIKSLLRSFDEILPLERNNANDVVTLHKYRKGLKIPTENLATMKTVEFSEAWNRLKIFQQDPDLQQPQLASLMAHFESLNKLNELRNRIWHRGTYVLHFDELTQFIGKYIFPVINHTMSSLNRENSEERWKYKPLHCKIDPIVEITNIVTSENQNRTWRLLTLLELGRAAYVNPIAMHFAKDAPARLIKTSRYERNASSLVKETAPWISLQVCPVCGLETLIVDADISQEEEGAFANSLSAICNCCSYTVRELKRDPGRYGYYDKLFPI